MIENIKKKFFIKCVSIFVAIGLIFSSFGTFGFASPTVLPINSFYSTYIESAIPFNLGKVTNSANFSTSKVIVQIQDLHGDPQTQKNIASILLLKR